MLLMVRLTRHVATCLHFFINMKMIILILVGFFALARGWCRVLTWDRWISAKAQLVIVTCVARVVVMRFILTFFVLNLTFIVLGILVALLGGALALLPVHQAWLERLVAAIRRSLVIPFPFVFVVLVMTIAVIVILPLVISAVVLVASPAVAIVTSLSRPNISTGKIDCFYRYIILY